MLLKSFLYKIFLNNYKTFISAVLQFHSRAAGEVQIKGKNSNMYLAMNDKGKVYAEVARFFIVGRIFKVSGHSSRIKGQWGRKFSVKGQMGWHDP
ncbi:unnamed protein product [Larinioides sclopetarius]|uniref:Uncharacterized protein n=1 Tax=Larinioides sclopetarius TaxID=280406 RepID=A0AAV1ZZL3_9ARAC